MKYRLLVLILFFSAFVRFYKLADFPPSLNWDEVSHAYTAYSLLFTGADQWGKVLPFPNFRAYGDYPTVLNVYLTVPAIAIFKATDFAARFPHALIGTLTVLVTFVAAYYWSKKTFVALLAAALIGFSPWTLFPSRAVFQSNWAVFLLALGLALFYSKRTVWAAIFWGLSLLAYHNTRVFVPILLLATLPVVKLSQKYVISVLLIVFFSGLILLNRDSQARGNWLSVLNPGAISYLDQSRNQSHLPPVITKLIYNRPVYFVTRVTGNYLDYFSPQFIFLKGGTQYQYSLPENGLITWVLLPFFYFGLYCLYRNKDWFLLIWLALAPLPAAITQDRFAVIRATAMIPAVVMAISLGISRTWEILSTLRKTRMIIFTTIAIIGFISFVTFLSDYFSSYPAKYSQSWQFGYKQVIAEIKTMESSFDSVVISKRYGEPHEYLFWYLPVPPAVLQSSPSGISWDYHDNWYWVNKYSKYVFVNDWEMPQYINFLSDTGKTLIVSSPDNPTSAKILNTINFLDGQTAFYLKTK